MFVSIVFPLADFRSLHPESAGRLDRPRWGEHDPQAKFARGFGSIHTRTKSGAGFTGENYYADCENLVKYPSQTFVSALIGENRPILSYPIYRRFYYDGQMSGRFEFGFRLNEPSIDDVLRTATYKKISVNFDPIAVVKQLLTKSVQIQIPDGRRIESDFVNASEALRDSYIISSTANAKLSQFDISSVGANFVSVGMPFAFLRAGHETPIVRPKGHRPLFSGSFDMFGAPSGCHVRNIDSVVIASKESLDSETQQERFARLFYTQIRALSFAHSFFLKQVDNKNFAGTSPLEPAVTAMLDRLQNLTPVEDDPNDALLCSEMAKIVENSDVNAERLSQEIDKRFKKGFFRRHFSGIFRKIDQKTDVAIEAAVSTATKHALTGGL